MTTIIYALTYAAIVAGLAIGAGMVLYAARGAGRMATRAADEVARYLNERSER